MMMARCDEGLNGFCEVKCPLVARGLQIALGNVLHNVIFERLIVGRENQKSQVEI